MGTATVRKALALVQSILSFAVVEERLEFNAAAAVRKPRYERARKPEIFVPLDVEQLKSTLDARSAALVSLLAYSGPRPEEALRLSWSDVGTEALHYVDSKRRRERWTPLLAPLAADLRAWRLESGRPSPSAPVIPAHDGVIGRPTTVATGADASGAPTTPTREAGREAGAARPHRAAAPGTCDRATSPSRSTPGDR